MSKTPMRSEDALIEAEETCFARLCEILGLEGGVDAFISTNGGKYDCAVFDIGYLSTGITAGFVAGRHHFRGRVDLYSRNRKQVQRWIGRLLCAMPLGTTQAVPSDIATTTTVEVFRIVPTEKSVDEITTVELKADKDAKGVPVFTSKVDFDIVFTVGTDVSA